MKYFDPGMLELETLSPWQTLEHGERVFHDEVWSLIKKDPEIDHEQAIRAYVYPLVRGK
ncbi:MAG: hypothetical protein AAGU15_02190 [Anaerolineaceae bacterium]